VIVSGGFAASFDASGAYVVDNAGDAGVPVDFDHARVAASFVPEVLDADLATIVVPAFVARLRAGLPVLLVGTRSAPEAAAAGRIAAARAAREPELDLGYSGLRAFPAEVLGMPWLRRLVLDGNRIGRLPDEIDVLADLDHLSVRSCGLAALPASVGKLAGLRVLRVADNWTTPVEADPDRQPVALPDSIGRLENLEELDVSRLSTGPRGDTTEFPEPTPYPLPDTAGRLVGLRRLVADGTNLVLPASMTGLAGIEEISLAGHGRARLHRVPDTVATFANLARLTLNGNPLRGLPPGILALPGLVELDLDDALGHFDGPLPDLSGLRRLRILKLAGGGAGPGRQPPHSVLRSLAEMDLPALEALKISHWDAAGDRSRPRMTADVLAGIGRFRGLRRLDLSGNGLTELPEEIYVLPALEWIDLRHNRLGRAARRRLATEHPGAHVDFRYQVLFRAEREEAQSVTELARQVRILAGQQRRDEAINGCEQALARYRDGLDIAGDLLFLQYVKLRAHTERRNAGGSPDPDADLRASVVAAETCLRLLSAAVDDRIETRLLTDLEREALQYAANTVAWRAVTADPPADRAELARALTLTDAATAQGGGDLRLADTHIRVLLATGHDSQAWAALDRALSVDPAFGPLQDLRADPRYQVRTGPA
jgi:Leucine-rich repeat (LRR) protein